MVEAVLDSFCEQLNYQHFYLTEFVIFYPLIKIPSKIQIQSIIRFNKRIKVSVLVLI